MVWRELVAPHSLYQTFCLSSLNVDGSGPLPLRQQLLAAVLPLRARVQSRARRWAELWALLAKQEGDAEHVVDLPKPQIMEEILEVIENIPEEYTLERIGEQIVDTPVPQVAAKDTLQERISERMHEQIVDVPVPQVAFQERI